MTYPNLHTPEEKLADGKKRLNIPTIVAICGSTRFMPEMAEADLRETAAGRIVVKPGCDMKTPHPLWADPAEAEALKVRLDGLHRAKIRLADEVLIVTTSAPPPPPRSTTPASWASPSGSHTPTPTPPPDVAR